MTGRGGGHPLAAVPLFAGLSSDQLDRVVGSASARRLHAGEWLFHEGDPGDGMYVVSAGSIDVVAGGSSAPVVVRTLGRGQSIGELSLLTGEPRSLGALARRDSDLARIGRDDFEALLLAEPSFALALMRVLGQRLRDTRSPSEAQTAPPRVIALVPLHDGAPVAAIAADVGAALQAIGSVARVDAGEPVALEMLDRLEAEHDRVLLVAAATNDDDPWTAFCLRQSDRVVGVADRPRRGAMRAPGSERVRGCDLAFVARAGVEPDLAGWMDAVDPRTTHILRAGSSVGIRRMARRLAGRALGVVLSGGGARGLAHVGVLEELQRAGYEIDRIGGVSMGGMVGSLFAEGRSAGECMAVMDELYVRSSPLDGRTIPLVALSRGVRGFAAQQRVHGDRCIEGLDVNFYCVSADLVAQRSVVHRRGPVAVAVCATQALPAFVPPLKDGDRMLVDGAILNNLPVEPMRLTGEGPVLAIDVSGNLPPPRPPRWPPPRVLRAIVGPAAEWAPPIRETLLRSILLGNADADADARERADAVIRPKLRGVPTMRFRDLASVRERGREAGRAAIEAGLVDAVVAR